jgi:hypothetical protein
MEEVEILGTFDSEETAKAVSKALNAWFHWLMEGNLEEPPELFEDFGLTTGDYALERETDIDWPEPPRARVRGIRVAITAETTQTVDTLQELLEALGAFDVYQADEDGEESE